MTRPHCSAQASTDADVLSTVTRALDTLVLIGQQYQGLLPSVMDATTGQMFEQPPDPIVGQRQGDRARWGCNLMHDHPLLWTLLGMSEILGRADYAQAVDRYLSRFTSHCVDTPSGLFPWGEHAYWRLDRDCFGNSNAEVGSDPSYPIIHDHLRAAPSWLWHRINALNPTCVQRYAHGLDYHFKFDEPTEFSRHACLMAGDPDLPDHKGYTAAGRPRRLTGPHDGANDFPRHSGFYAMDIAYAWSQSGDETLLPMLHRAADYWWLKRNSHRVLPLQSRGPDIQHHAPQTLSLALSLCEAADMLSTGPHKDTTLAASYRERAAYYIECCYADQTYDDRDAVLHAKGRAWGGQYGARGYILCTYPNLFLGLYRQTGEQRLLDTAMLLSARIATTPLPNTNELTMPAADIAMALMALVDLYVMTGDKCWYNDAMILGHQALTLYFQYDLPIGATGIHWYESQLGTSYLLYALAKLACLECNLDITTMGFEISNR
jgi:hypothetical protein